MDAPTHRNLSKTIRRRAKCSTLVRQAAQAHATSYTDSPGTLNQLYKQPKHRQPVIRAGQAQAASYTGSVFLSGPKAAACKSVAAVFPSGLLLGLLQQFRKSCVCSIVRLSICARRANTDALTIASHCPCVSQTHIWGRRWYNFLSCEDLLLVTDNPRGK